MKEAFMTLKPDLVFEHVKFVFPTAPLIRYTTGDIDVSYKDPSFANI